MRATIAHRELAEISVEGDQDSSFSVRGREYLLVARV